jgi:transcriptional regulator with XRE-family HTH domain
MEPGAEFGLRALHRQMYVDLIRAYLRDYGSQRDLARALGITEAYVSFLLEPFRAVEAKRRSLHWASSLRVTDYEIVEAFKFLKTPSEERAEQIADQLCTDVERRDVLLYHINLARRPSIQAREKITIPADQAQSILTTIGDIHQVALFDPDASVNRDAYSDVWDRAARLAEVIDPLRNPLEYAQVLMYLHDAAQVFNRPDLSLGYARKAILALSSLEGRVQQAAVRLQINALLAEAVSLNTLGLTPEAMAIIGQAAHTPGYRYEPESWLRSFLEQQLTAFARSPRVSIYRAEKVTDLALNLVPSDGVIQAGIRRKLLDVCITHATARSRRKADELAVQLIGIASTDDYITPLRRAQILVTLHRYSRFINNVEEAAKFFSECMLVTKQANLFHQQQQLLLGNYA